MIRLSYSLLEKPIEFKENTVNVLVLESPRCFRELFEHMKLRTMNENSYIYLSKDYEDINFDKYADVIFSINEIQLNNKKILNKVYDNLNQIAYSEETYLKTTEMKTSITNYLQYLLQNSDCLLTYDDFDIEVLFKSVGLKIDTEETSLLRKICDYIDVMSKFFNIKIFIFFHLKEYLEKEELLELYKYCNYNKQSLLLCENVRKTSIPYEKLTLIDEDLCQIS